MTAVPEPLPDDAPPQEIPCAPGWFRRAVRSSRAASDCPNLVVADNADPEHEAALTRRRRWQAFGVYVANAVLHGLLLCVLALIVLPVESLPESFRIFSAMESPPEDSEMLDLLEQDLPEQIAESLPAEVLPEIVRNPVEPVPVELSSPAAPIPEPGAADIPIAPAAGHLGGRGQASREALLSRYGGTPESEAAVVRALKWLERHQQRNGSWSFNHRTPECDRGCSQPGSYGRSNMGATSLALLTYLGSGSSYTGGDYQKTIERGIAFLLRNAKEARRGRHLDLRGRAQGHSGMYIQGLATLCLTEIIAMNELAMAEAGRGALRIGVKDAAAVREETRQLKIAAQKAINFIADAQHSGGGWRYSPGEAGDTSVVGWQIMALTSGRSAKLRVPRTVFSRASRFLDRVSVEGGAWYGYTGPAKTRSTTAIGLLCRMYLGWDRLRAGLRNGVQVLASAGPARNDMYYNYYATQVLHHWGGDEWTEWNERMREQLVTTQKRKGHADGSWDVADRHGSQGGRLYMTCLAAMTLEVYYRHLPLYETFDRRPVAER